MRNSRRYERIIPQQQNAYRPTAAAVGSKTFAYWAINPVVYSATSAVNCTSGCSHAGVTNYSELYKYFF